MVLFSQSGPRQKIINQELGKKTEFFISLPEELNSFQNQRGIYLNTDQHTLMALDAALRGLTANFPGASYMRHKLKYLSSYSRRNSI